jgi:hypothetical protein
MTSRDLVPITAALAGHAMPLGSDTRNSSAAPTGSVKVRGWKYRGKHYSVVQSLRHHTWKWSVDVNRRVKSGKALSREIGIQLAERVIDRALFRCSA